MSEAKPSYEVEQRIARARERKALRYIDHFFGKMREAGVQKPEKDKAALEKALAIVRDASQEQWKKLAKDMGEKDAPSGMTVSIVVRRLEVLIADFDRQAKDDAEVIDLLFGQRGTGSVGAQVALEDDR